MILSIKYILDTFSIPKQIKKGSRLTQGYCGSWATAETKYISNIFLINLNILIHHYSADLAANVICSLSKLITSLWIRQEKHSSSQ